MDDKGDYVKVGLVLESYDPRRGGLEQWTHQFANALAKREHEVHIIAGDVADSALAARDHQEHGITLHRFPRQHSRLARAHAAAQMIPTLDMDVVHDMGIGWYCDLFHPHGGSIQAAFEHNLLLIPPPLRPVRRLAARLLPRYREFNALASMQYAGNHLVVALSNRVRQHLRQYHAVSEDRIRTIYNGVDLDRFSPRNQEQHRDRVRRQLAVADETLFLIVAHNLKLKGVPAVLRALARLVDQGYAGHVVVAGGKRTGHFQSMAHRLGVGQAVTFLGPVDDTVPYYAAADAYLHPTFYDPCSLVALEALASGLPTVTSRYNGVSELMESGHEGFVLDDPADSITLARHMIELTDRKQRARMAVAARQTALRHSFDDNVRRIVDVYDEIHRQKQN